MESSGKLKKQIEDSYGPVRDAIGSEAKSIARELRKLGKRCTPDWVRQQGLPQESIKRTNFYESFLLWLTALFYANYTGFERLWEHLQTYVADLERGRLEENGTRFPIHQAIGELVRMKRHLRLLEMTLEVAE